MFVFVAWADLLQRHAKCSKELGRPDYPFEVFVGVIGTAKGYCKHPIHGCPQLLAIPPYTMNLLTVAGARDV